MIGRDRQRGSSSGGDPVPTPADIRAIEAVAQEIYMWNRRHATWYAVIAVSLLVLASTSVMSHGRWAAAFFFLAVPFLIRGKNHARKTREMLKLNAALLTVPWNKSMVLLNRLLLHMLGLYEPSTRLGKLRDLFKHSRNR